MYKLATDINPNIFRGYDLRGVSEKDLSEDVYYTLGKGYATFLSQRRITKATIGHDNRKYSPEYARAFTAGLNDGGVDTIFMGYSLSQITYFSAYEYKTKGTAMITASHNPGEYNGLKLGVGYSDTMVTEEIQYLREICQKGKFVEGHGKNVEQDIFPKYKQHILSYFNLKKPWKVVIDSCNTTSGMFYPEIFRGAGCEVIEQNCQLDSNFPLGAPDPTEVGVLERLAERVKKEGANIGFAYDADGDRMSAVDEKGQVLWMDTVVSLFAQDVLDFMPGSKIVYNTLCSRQVTETIEKAGGIPVMWLTGHSFIKAKVKEDRAPFGGELSGHIFFMDNFFGHDDGAYASLRLLQYLERTSQTLSQAVSKLSQYVSSPEIKFGLADEIKFEFVSTKIKAEFKKHWPDAHYTDIEGVRMDTKTQMAIARASQNGPYITLKFEGKTKEEYETLKKTLKQILSQYKEIDWTTGVNTHELD